LISDYNKQAIDQLTSKNFNESFQLLKKAQHLLNFLDSSERLQAITYNNLGCFYKTVKKHQLALQMFEKSLELKSCDKAHQAGTYLNMSSIFSVLNNHKKALEYSVKALQMLKNLYKVDSSVASSLIIAAFTTGKECECLDELIESQSQYNYALELSSRTAQTYMTQKIKDALLELDKKLPFVEKPRYSSAVRHSELPKIKNNQNNYMKQYIIIEDKKKFTPKILRNYPPILDIPLSKPQSSTISSPFQNNNNQKLKQIKKELMEYEQKFKKISGLKKNPRIRFIPKETIPQIPLKLYKKNNYNAKSAPNPEDLRKFAVIIQKNWRGFQARKSCRQERRKMAHKKAKEAIEELEYLKQQAKNDELYTDTEIWRPKTHSTFKSPADKTLLKHQTIANFYNQLHHIIKIQSFFRMIVKQKAFQKLRKSALIIQKNIKKFQCAKLFQKILSAILFIQCQWRKYLAKKKKIV
jgi:tetratricopeptide (TPR) repeat protein